MERTRRKPTHRTPFFDALTAAIAVLTAGAIGSAATAGAGLLWYAELVKPAWTPPGWVFGPVWFVLYALMAVAFYLGLRAVHTRRHRYGKFAVIFFLLHLIANALWSVLFFALASPFWALLELALLWLMVLALLVFFGHLRRVNTWLLLPYFLWVSFALVLNLSLWQLNTSDTPPPGSAPSVQLGERAMERDLAERQTLRSRIDAAIDRRATDLSQCAIIGIGAKPCGGPWEYAVYARETTNEDQLHARVDALSTFEKEFNRKYGIVSDCSVTSKPLVSLKDGRCVVE